MWGAVRKGAATPQRACCVVAIFCWSPMLPFGNARGESSPAWAYKACAEPGDKLLGPHSWEGALGRADAEASNFCSWLRPCDSSLIVCTLQFDKLL